jgi:hypothetical protein
MGTYTEARVWNFILLDIDDEILDGQFPKGCRCIREVIAALFVCLFLNRNGIEHLLSSSLSKSLNYRSHSRSVLVLIIISRPCCLHYSMVVGTRDSPLTFLVEGSRTEALPPGLAIAELQKIPTI